VCKAESRLHIQPTQSQYFVQRLDLVRPDEATLRADHARSHALEARLRVIGLNRRDHAMHVIHHRREIDLRRRSLEAEGRILARGFHSLRRRQQSL
jgi:hypothetical protein